MSPSLSLLQSFKWKNRSCLPNHQRTISLRSNSRLLFACYFTVELYSNCQTMAIMWKLKCTQMHFIPNLKSLSTIIQKQLHTNPVWKSFWTSLDPERAWSLKHKVKTSKMWLVMVHEKSWGKRDLWKSDQYHSMTWQERGVLHNPCW